MALESFEYSKTWRSADDFPTIETDETQVRDDIQCLFDEIATGLNGLTSELNSGGVDTAQLADGAVTGDKLSPDVRAAIAEKELYWATYGSSNGPDIYSAVTANHLPAVKYSGRTYILSDQFVDVGSGYFNFVFTALTDGGSMYYVVCNQTTLVGLSWTNGSRVLGTYSKPDGGIPKEDLASSVQTSLEKADTAYQKPPDGIPAGHLSYAVKASLNKANISIPQPPTPSNGQILRYDSGTTSWNAVNFPTMHEVPSGGASGQVLAKNSNTDYDFKWVNQSGGADIYLAVKGTTTAAEVESAYQSGKTIFARDSVLNGGVTEYLYYSLYDRVDENDFIFTAAMVDGVAWLTLDMNGWADHYHTIPDPQTSGTPAALGTAARGSETTYSRSDHVHPLPWTPPANDGTYVLKCVKSGSSITYSWEAQT